MRNPNYHITIRVAVATLVLLQLQLLTAGQPLRMLKDLMSLKDIDTESDSAKTVLSMWNSTFPEVIIPPLLLGRLSPLHEKDVERFSSMIARGSLSQKSVEFCETSNLSCNSSIGRFSPSGTVFVAAVLSTSSTDVNPCTPKSNITSQSELFERDNVFFPEETLGNGRQVMLPDLHDPVPMKAFLPRSLAVKFPFSCEGLEDLDNMLNISKHSNMSYNMAMVIKACETPSGEGQIKRCITSVEDMLEMVASTIGSHVEVLSEPSIQGSQELVTVIEVKVTSSTSPLSCHSFVFPFGVYYCHYLKGSEVFNLTLKSEQGTVFERSAVCHAWSPSLKQEFTALHLSSQNKACHWLYGSNLLWVPKS
ncbi:hypothetical protein O6H91_15G004300 [Diphasiastrum complanatum]|uniref:Uncharacterized protein n=1 Tax=Diphasiastrum complanatum TaxID=34168 RepID=A0ACC2BF79_DIPCM|nr:hypothetical protein O6H91_15G004300 [Diphasiastrum complanatum]